MAEAKKNKISPLNLNAKTNKGLHALHLAAAANQYAIIELLSRP